LADPRDIEVLDGAYAEWARGDFTRWDMFTEDAEFVVAGPEPRTYVGRDGVRQGTCDARRQNRAFRDVLEPRRSARGGRPGGGLTSSGRYSPMTLR
jgi:hypothetical protein